MCDTNHRKSTKKDFMRTVKDMALYLGNCECLVVFPGRTFGDGIGMLPFHSNLIQSAIEGDAYVETLTLQFVGNQCDYKYRFRTDA